MKYEIETLDAKTWLIKEFDDTSSVYMYLLEGEREAMLIDAGFGTIPLDRIVKELTSLPVSLLLTHGHGDHIGGAGYFETVLMMEADMPLYRSHSERAMREAFAQDVSAPVKEDITFLGDCRFFDLGGRTLEIIETPGHSLGSICILDKERRWLFTGDTCCKAHVLFFLPCSGTLEGYKEALEAMYARRGEYDITWPAHHARPVENEIILEFIEATELLLAGKLESRTCQGPFGSYRLAEYKHVGIEY